MPNYAFIIGELLVLPVTLVYAGFFLYRCHKYKDSPERDGASITAAFVIAMRYVFHELGLRPDAASAALWPHHPVAPPLIVCQMFIWGQRFVQALVKLMRTGSVSVGMDLLPKRFAFFDRTIAECGCEQLVLMGAGFEARPYNADPRCTGNARRVFEVDRPETQLAKRALLNAAKLKSDKVTYVQVNFAKESWSQKLIEAGLDDSKPFYMLWEGVAGYLPEQVVIDFFNEAAVHLAKNPNSRLAFNYLVNYGNIEPFCKWVHEPHLSKMSHDLEGYLAKAAPGLKILEIERVTHGGIAIVAAT